MSNVLDTLPRTWELLRYQYKDALVDDEWAAVRDTLFWHNEGVAKEVGGVLFVSESSLTGKNIILEQRSKVFIGADDIFIDLRLEDEVTDSVYSNIAAHLNAGLHRQGTYKNKQTQEDYDVHNQGLKWISFAISTSDYLINLAYASVDYVFFWRRKEFDGVWILHT